MKSSERKTYCPICHKEVSTDYLKHHIAQMARKEREYNLQRDKPHCTYLCQQIKK